MKSNNYYGYRDESRFYMKKDIKYSFIRGEINVFKN